MGARLKSWMLMLLALCVTGTGPLLAQEFLTEAQALELAFPGDAVVTRARGVLDKEAQASLAKTMRSRKAPRILRYHVGKRGDTLLGYALIENVIGKTQPITYMLHVGPDLAIRSVGILAYRESHGSEVRREPFRAQFKGKGPKSLPTHGKNIRNIAGATLSCRHLTDDIHDLLRILSALDPGAQVVQEEAVASAQAPNAPNTEGPWSRSRMLMGTTLTITAHGADETAVQLALQAAFDAVALIETRSSSWRPDSEVSKLSDRAGPDAEWLKLSEGTAEMLTQAQRWSQASGGALDPTVGALTALWRLARDRAVPPTLDELQAARATVGADALVIRPDGLARLTRTGARLDCGAFGKGYALDRAADVLRQHGVTQVLLNFGGQLLALDPPPHETGWPVVVRDPRAASAAPLQELLLANSSLSVSADDQRGLEFAGTRVSHVLDPRTGSPKQNAVLSAAVLAPTAMEADAWSTIYMVLEAKESERMIALHGHRVAILTASGAQVQSPTWAGTTEATPR